MTENEFQEYENVKTRNLKYFVPMLWFNNLLSKARQEGRIFDGMTYNLLLKVSNQDKGTDRNCLYVLFFGGGEDCGICQDVRVVRKKMFLTKRVPKFKKILSKFFANNGYFLYVVTILQ